MSFDTWLWFCATEAILCFTPGPAVLLVVSLALGRGAADGMKGSLGILAANTGYFALSATSLGAVLLASWELFALIKWAGAAYLVWTGLRTIVACFRGREQADGGHPAPAGRLGSFFQGLITQGANPKALLFFSAILPQFLDANAPILPQLTILAVSSVVIELAVLALYVAACRQARGLASRPRFALPLQAAGGALLVAAGARLAALSVARDGV
ncbi:MAG TPA: LysE family translocator [Candidatus Polarisedimenticolia bacterium]|nr:LysE family translocator [Candidatus Polarisedimenticolia bacterium]